MSDINRLRACIFIPKIWYESYNAEFLSVCNEIRCKKYHMPLFLLEHFHTRYWWS